MQQSDDESWQWQFAIFGEMPGFRLFNRLAK